MTHRADRVLAVLASAHFPVRLEVLTRLARLTARQASDGARALIRRGLAEHVDAAGKPAGAYDRPVYYRATAEGRQAASNGTRVRSGPSGAHTGRRAAPADTFRSRLWQALRRLRKATVPDLVQLAAKGDEADAEANAHRYLKALVASGHVALLPARKRGRAQGSNGFKQFVLVRDTGPRPPERHPVRREVYDPNTRESHHV